MGKVRAKVDNYQHWEGRDTMRDSESTNETLKKVKSDELRDPGEL